MAGFPGFARPKSNFYRLPNDWFEIWSQAREELAQGSQPARIVAPLKLVEYVIKYTWGRINFDEPIRLSRSDFRLGRRGRNNSRLDKGTGLSSEGSISNGISIALRLGLLEQIENNQDPARQERFYLPRLRPPDEDTPFPQPGSGFTRPEANFFLVPYYWTDLTADMRSEITILAVEYFFRHTWGWQTGEYEIRWLEIDDVANGRKYRSPERQGERYDQGIGYSIRKLRDALEEGISRKLLVWRGSKSTGKEYALRMAWMEAVADDGQFDPEAGDLAGFSTIWDQIVEEEDQIVGGRDQVIGDKDQVVEGADQVVGGEDQTVGDRDQVVGGRDRSVEGEDQLVDRTYKDTSNKTDSKNSHEKTIITKHRPHIVDSNIKSELAKLLIPAGLNGAGLNNLLNKIPPLDLQKVRAVILYAEAQGLNPGYIYRHLDSNAPVDGLFKQFAALDEKTLALFRQGVQELKVNGTFRQPLSTPIPPQLTGLFVQFAEVFAGREAATVLAALSYGGKGEGESEAMANPPDPDELDLFWDQVVRQLRLEMTQSTFDSWVRETRLLARRGPKFTILVKNSFAKEWLENRLYGIVERVVADLIQAPNDPILPEVELEFLTATSD